MAHPDHFDVLDLVKRFTGHVNLKLKSIGLSPKLKLDIPALEISDYAVPNKSKQKVLIISGQHGSEESGRSIAMALIEFLLSDAPDAVETRKNQIVCIAPSCNPDGAQADTYRNASDQDTAHDFPFDAEQVIPESKMLLAYAREFRPDLFIDIHGLAGGSMKERIWMVPQHIFSPNQFYMTKMADVATQASESLGYPTCEPKIPEFIQAKNQTGLLGEWLSREMNTLSFGVEAIEKYYTIKEWQEQGMAKLKALLAYGNQDAFGIGFKGYPNFMIAGNRICGLIAYDSETQDYRKNREVLTKWLLNNYVLIDRDADGVVKETRVIIENKDNSALIPNQLGLILRFKKPFTFKNLFLNKTPISESKQVSWSFSEISGSVQMVIKFQNAFDGALPKHLLQIKYESPYIS